MARGVAVEPTFSLKDQLFNAETLGQLGREYAAAVPGFDGPAFVAQALGGVADRTLIACLDWFADCLEPQLAPDFPTMAQQLEAAMPPRLDPTLRDDDFGQFIHAVPGVLAVRHGLEQHRDRALDLLYAATQRFSMEFYIRPFLNRWPDETLTRLTEWARDDNYHVRRLVSEGTRPKLPWARNITLAPDRAWPLLDTLHADTTRFVTRSVANHLNDLTKTDTAAVVERLARWAQDGQQNAKELDWMTRHALRTAVKAGDAEALALLGFSPGCAGRGVVGVGAAKPGYWRCDHCAGDTDSRDRPARDDRLPLGLCTALGPPCGEGVQAEASQAEGGRAPDGREGAQAQRERDHLYPAPRRACGDGPGQRCGRGDGPFRFALVSRR
ncbi:MAG: DNA alkylation repair protein [Pseudomonadota bacterium]